MVGAEPGGLVYSLAMDGMKELTSECDKSQVAGIVASEARCTVW
ncbi:MAG: hypothetical protein ACLR0U_13575 [Enterocloster clostridioformis]